MTYYNEARYTLDNIVDDVAEMQVEWRLKRFMYECQSSAKLPSREDLDTEESRLPNGCRKQLRGEIEDWRRNLESPTFARMISEMPQWGSSEEIRSRKQQLDAAIEKTGVRWNELEKFLIAIAAGRTARLVFDANVRFLCKSTTMMQFKTTAPSVVIAIDYLIKFMKEELGVPEPGTWIESGQSPG